MNEFSFTANLPPLSQCKIQEARMLCDLSFHTVKNNNHNHIPSEERASMLLLVLERRRRNQRALSAAQTVRE